MVASATPVKKMKPSSYFSALLGDKIEEVRRTGGRLPIYRGEESPSSTGKGAG